MTETTNTISIRVPASLKTQLEKMSKKQQLNLNILVNQILSKNVEWNEHITKMGWLQFHPAVVKEIFMHLDEQDISKIASAVKTDIINSIKFIYGTASLENTIKFIETWLRSTNTSFRHSENEKSHKFIITHNLGKNWSIFAIIVCEKFISELGFKFVTNSIDKNCYSYEILQE